ncbi:MAG: AAA family ATPase, partial [Terriglobia bacterium]
MKLFSENVVLLFPSDRFEPPDWLNQQSLSTELQFPEPILMQGFTARRILSKQLLKPTLDWLQAILFDRFLTETQLCSVTVEDGNSLPKQVPALLLNEGKTTAIFNSARLILSRILGVEENALQLGVEGRNSRRFVASIVREGKLVARIPNLLGLSAGQSALFCLFCNIIRDFDLADARFSKPEEIRGIVLIDEADLHLHLDLQYRVLPELIRMFPKVQFIVTAHSPLFVMGMREAFTENGFWLVDLPSGTSTSTEAYSEFVQAFEAFGGSKAFQERLLGEARKSARPLVLVEGKHDKAHIEVAWDKLQVGRERPFDVLSCGDDSTGKSQDKGGAKRLNSMLEVLGRFEQRVCVGLFDNDCQGASQHRGLG